MLYFLMIGIVIAIFFSITIAFNLKHHFKNEILPNISQYLIYITEDIGTPPNLEKAAELSHSLAFKLRIKGLGLDWQSHKKIKADKQLEFEAIPAPFERFQIARSHGKNYVKLYAGEYEFTYVMGRPAKPLKQARSLLLLAIVIVLMALLFLLIKRSLKPMETIAHGVKQIAGGELNSPIEVTQSAEFEHLAQGINNMAKEIKGMLEAKQQLLLAISHELRSPITRMQVNCALLPDSDIQQAVKRDIAEMESLISQILESQRLNSSYRALNLSQVSLDTLVQQVVNQFFSGQELTLKLSLLTIEGDQTRLTLLIKNLIDNALKYSVEQRMAPEISLFEQHGNIVLRIEDFGVGIDSDELKHVSQAFYRVDRARQRSTGGFGLGLYLCQLIADAHKAKMQLSSVINQGTVVNVSFNRRLD